MFIQPHAIVIHHLYYSDNTPISEGSSNHRTCLNVSAYVDELHHYLVPITNAHYSALSPHPHPSELHAPLKPLTNSINCILVVTAILE